MAIKNIKLPDGRNVEIDEWLHWPQFSTIEVAAGIGFDLRAFSYVVGNNIPQAGAVPGGARTATESDTNQVARSRLNHDEAFIVFSMTYEHFAIDNTSNISNYVNAPADTDATPPIFTGTNLRILQLQVMMELFVGAGITKPMASAPLEYYGQGIGAVAYGSGDALDIAVGGATALNLNYGTGGSINPKTNQRRWQLPVYIHSDRVMFVRLFTPAGTGTAGNSTGDMAAVNQSYRLKVYLDGLKRRPVA